MKSSLLAVVALAASALFAAPSHAVPINYDLQFNALLGPSGTGAFTFDDETRRLTDFGWDFGNSIVGGLNIVNGPFLVIGDTLGSFVAELLTQTDIHLGVNCIASTCSYAGPFVGSGPGNVNRITFSAGPAYGAAVFYSFAHATPGPLINGIPSPAIVGESVANGYLTATVRAVPEPAVLLLMIVGLLSLGLVSLWVATHRAR